MLYHCKDSDLLATSSAMLEKSVVDKYLSLPQCDRVCATYIWIDGTGEGLRSKVREVLFS